MAELALQQKKAKLALKALGHESVVMERNKPLAAKSQWLRFKAYSLLKDVDKAKRHAAYALEAESPSLVHKMQLELGLWRLKTDLDMKETQRLLVEGVLGSPAYGSLQEWVVLLLLNLPNPNETELEKIVTGTGEQKIVNGQGFSHDVIGSLYGLLRNTSAMLNHFGMTCQCACEGNELTWRGFGSAVAEAYEKPSVAPQALIELLPNDTSPIFLSRPAIPIDAVRQLKVFFHSSPTFWPVGERGLFRGHLRTLASPEASLVDSMIAAMHLQLPTWLRTRATHAEWWSHVRPEREYIGHRQFFQGHACHTDDYDHGDGSSLATSVLYLSDSSAATLVVNQSTTSSEVDPVAWVVHPRESFMVTFNSSLWHCVLPPKHPEMAPLRASLNVLWLSQGCQSEQYGEKYCQHRPSTGWPWEPEVKAQAWPVDESARHEHLWVPTSVRAFPVSESIPHSRIRMDDL